jgi:hypothetical protein
VTVRITLQSGRFGPRRITGRVITVFSNGRRGRPYCRSSRSLQVHPAYPLRRLGPEEVQSLEVPLHWADQLGQVDPLLVPHSIRRPRGLVPEEVQSLEVPLHWAGQLGQVDPLLVPHSIRRPRGLGRQEVQSLEVPLHWADQLGQVDPLLVPHSLRRPRCRQSRRDG